jgi:sulfur-oxidizing protein SoxY
MNDPIERRSFLRAVGVLGFAAAVEGVAGAGRRLPAAVRASRLGPDDPPVPNEIVQKIYDERFQGRPIQHGRVTLDMPAMAEDGRYVPVLIESDLPMDSDDYVKSVFLIVDHNPDPLVSAFHFVPPMAPVNLETRIKMKRTSWIRAIAETSGGALYADYQKVETTLNGCG